jgi:hypothetical protein
VTRSFEVFDVHVNELRMCNDKITHFITYTFKEHKNKEQEKKRVRKRKRERREKERSREIPSLAQPISTATSGLSKLASSHPAMYPAVK